MDKGLCMGPGSHFTCNTEGQLVSTQPLIMQITPVLDKQMTATAGQKQVTSFYGPGQSSKAHVFGVASSEHCCLGG